MDAISGTRQNTATKNKPDIAPGTFLTQLQALCKFWSSVDSQSCPIDSGWRLIYHWKRLESHCCEIPYRIFSPILWGFFWSEPRQLPHLRYVNKKARSFYAAGFVFSLSLAVMLPTYWFSVWWCFWGAPVASVSISCPSCSATDGVVRNGKSTAGHQRSLCSHCRKTWQLQFTYTASQPGTHQKIIDMAMNGVGCRATARIMGVGLNTILRHLKNSGRSR